MPAQGVVAGAGDDAAFCQTVQAPAGTGSRLVPHVTDGRLRAVDALGQRVGEAGDEAEIRLTYRELSALIEDAIRNLR